MKLDTDNIQYANACDIIEEIRKLQSQPYLPQIASIIEVLIGILQEKKKFIENNLKIYEKLYQIALYKTSQYSFIKNNSVKDILDNYRYYKDELSSILSFEQEKVWKQP